VRVAVFGGFDELLGGFPSGGVIVDADEDRWGDEDFVVRVDRCGGQDEASDQTESHPVG
jgi:hypothetical protein